MFRDREEAGRQLAKHLEHLRGEDIVVLGLPRGGVPVAYQVARSLDAPLDVIVVRKLGFPSQPELAMGAIGEDGVRVINEELVTPDAVSSGPFAEVERRERAELERRVELFRRGRPRVRLEGRVAVIVDDGIATGSTVRAAAEVARALGARRVVVAAPVAPPGVESRLGPGVDEVVVVDEPETFFAIGQFYMDFHQVSDSEVADLLHRASSGTQTRSAPGVDTEIEVDGEGRRRGHLVIPPDAVGVVVFAHGSGSGRHSPRNRKVAELLNRAGLGTLRFDLLTPDEGMDRALVFDIGLLAERLLAAARGLARTWPRVNLGFFGASTGAAAALVAAVEMGSQVRAVVSRGGRPDLAASHLSRVEAPTLLIVGGNDPLVLDLNRKAQAELRCENRLEVVPGAGHLFEEPGTLDRVAELARDWFLTHLGG
jgi:putative phosphoribosyl transferase